MNRGHNDLLEAAYRGLAHDATWISAGVSAACFIIVALMIGGGI